MRCSVRRLVLAAAAAAAVSSCSQGQQEQSGTADSSSGPDIALKAAPGIAFRYNYQFNLADGRIAATQEAHAAACERLGPARCRITGLSYDVDEEERVSAALNLRLDATLARQFGKSAQKQVEAADGKLIRLAIGSSDEGEAIRQATAQRNDVSARAAELQRELARARPGSNAHANLVGQLQALREQGAERTRAIAGSQAALATTPVDLHYYGQGGVPGFRGDPLREAWRTFVATVVWLVGNLLRLLAVLVPLAAVGALGLALARTRPVRAVRRWVKGSEESEA